MSHKDLVFTHGDNYGIWKLRVMRHLATKDLFRVDLDFDGWVRKNPSILKGMSRLSLSFSSFLPLFTDPLSTILSTKISLFFSLHSTRCS
jgi:hypothetical protein